MNLLFLNLVWEEANRTEKLGKQYDYTFPTLQVTVKLNVFPDVRCSVPPLTGTLMM